MTKAQAVKLSMKACSSWRYTIEVSSLGPDTGDLNSDVEAFGLDEPNRLKKRRMVFQLDEGRRDDDSKWRSRWSASRRIKGCRVHSAGLNRHSPRGNAHLFELRYDGRADCDDVRGEAVNEADRAQDAGREASVKREQRRNAKEPDSSGRERLKVITV
jgi:hypothetical protein